MATLTTIETRVTNLVGSNVALSSTEILEIIQAEHDTILNDWSWGDRKEDSTLSTVGVYNTGTITTSGTSVTGTGTTFTSDMVGRYIRFSSQTQYFLITAYTSATAITIETSIPSGDLTNQAYVIFKNRFSLPSNCERITSMVYQTRLLEVPNEDIDRVDPWRSALSTIPTSYSHVEKDSSGNRQVEIWPVPNTTILLRFSYLKTNTLISGTDIPLYRADILVWKAATTAVYNLLAKTGDQSWAQLAIAYDAQYQKALQGAIMDDLGKNSVAHKIRDIYRPYWPGVDDFSISHDTLPW